VRAVRTAVLALLALLLLMQPALSQSPLPAGESEDLTVALLPDGTLTLWYGVVYPISALDRSATTLKELGIEGATLSVFFDGSDGPFTLQLEVYGEDVTEKAAADLASSIGRDLNLKLSLNSSTGSSYVFTSRLTLEELRRTIMELRPLTKSGGFAQHIDVDYLRRFKGAHIVSEIVRLGWGVSTSFEVRAFGDRLKPSGDRYTIDLLKVLGVNELRASEGALLNVMVVPPVGSDSIAYEVSPSGVAVRELVQGTGVLYVQLHGEDYLRRFAVEFSYNGTSVESFMGKLSDFMAFVDELESSGSLLNRTSHMGFVPTGGSTGLPQTPEETNATAPETPTGPTGPSEGITPSPPTAMDRVRSLPPVSGPENRGAAVDPLLILGLAVLAVAVIAFGTLYVNRGPRAAAKGTAIVTVSLLLVTSAVLPVLLIGTAYGQQGKGGVEPLVEVEQFRPGGAPPDLEIPLLFPAFKQIDKIGKTFISFEEIKVLATPALYAPYTPQGFQKLLATLGIDMRLIQAAGLILGGGLNPLGMFKGLTLAHGSTSAFITGESAGANVYMVFKAKPSSTLQSMLDVINTVYRIGYALYHSTICFPGDGCLHPIGKWMMITAILAAVYLAITAPGFMVYAYASYPSLVNDLYITWGAVDGPVAEDKERVWLAENRYMVSLAILILILRAPTLSGWRGSKGLADIPLTASFHVSSDADSGWKINQYLGVYSGDRGLKVAVDFRDAMGIWGLFQVLSGAFSSTWSSMAGIIAGSLGEVDATLEQAKTALRVVRAAGSAMSYVLSAADKIENAQRLIRDARVKLSNYNCAGAIQNVNGAKESISSAIQDLQAAIREDSRLQDSLNQVIQQLQRSLSSLEEFDERINGVCAPLNFRAEPASDPESLPEEQKITLTFLVFSATPLATQVVNSKGSSVIRLRAYYGWNPFPGITQGVAVTVRSAFETVRDVAYNSLDQLSSATSTIGDIIEPDLNAGIDGLLGNLGSSFAGELLGALNQILGPLVNMVNDIKSVLTSIKDKLTSFLDRLTEQIRAVFETVKNVIRGLVNQLVSAITNLINSVAGAIVGAILGPLLNGLVQPLVSQFNIIGQMIAQTIKDMIANFIKEQINKFVQDIIDDLLKPINELLANIDQLVNRILEPINAIKQKINEWHQQIVQAIDGWMNQLLGPIYNVLSGVKLDIGGLQGSGGTGRLGSSVKSIIGEFTASALSKSRQKVEEGVRKLNEQERKILGSLVRTRDAMIYASSMIRIPIIGRGGMMQATLFEIGKSAASDDYGYLGSIAVPHDVVKPVAGWYNEFMLVLHPVGGVIPFQADYSYVAPFLQDLIDLVGATPPSVTWVKVNEVGPVLRGSSVDIAILGDPKRPSLPGGRGVSSTIFTLPDGTMQERSIDDMPVISPFFPFPIDQPILSPFFPFPPIPPNQQPLLSPFFPFPPEKPAVIAVEVFTRPYEDQSARGVPQVLVPADTATGNVMLAPFFPFPPIPPTA